MLQDRLNCGQYIRLIVHYEDTDGRIGLSHRNRRERRELLLVWLDAKSGGDVQTAVWRAGRNPAKLGAMLSQDLLDILVCPACRNPLRYSETAQTLTCTACRRVYPIQDDIPILLVERATIEGA